MTITYCSIVNQNEQRDGSFSFFSQMKSQNNVMLVVLCTKMILFHRGFAFLHHVENAKKFDYFHDCCSDFSLNANCFKGQNKDSCQVKTKTTSFLLQTLSIVRSKWCHKELLLQKLWTKLHILLSSVTQLKHLVVSVCVSVSLLCVCVSVSQYLCWNSWCHLLKSMWKTTTEPVARPAIRNFWS